MNRPASADPGRRRFVAAAGVAASGLVGAALAACSSSSGPSSGSGSGSGRPDKPLTLRYGGGDSRYGQLHLPSGSGPAPVVVLVHGGFWLAEYGLDLMDDLAADVVRRGWAAWNVEYRRVGVDGGGWPGTFQDVAGAVDHLLALRGDRAHGPTGSRLDLDRVAVVGHSAGGQLATWAAGRPGLPTTAPGAGAEVRPVAAVSQAGVLDLARAARQGVGGSAVTDFMGGGPDDQPDRYAVGSPIERLPIAVPLRCVHGRQDSNVPFEQSQRYVDAATVAGDRAELAPFDGDHFDVIDPAHQSWTDTVTWLTARFAT